MAVQCPYCRHALSLMKAKPGRYAATCRECGRRFQVVVPDDPARKPEVAAIESERNRAAAEAGALAGGSLLPQPAPPVTDTDETGMPPGGVDPNSTVSVTPGPPAPGLGPNATAGLPKTVRDDPEPASTVREAHQRPAPSAGGADPSAPIGSDVETAVVEAPVVVGAVKAGAIPTVLGGYQVLQELGRGGMGAVYLARQLSLNRNVALKVMKPQWARNATFVARFTREAYAAAQLTHHNIVQIYDFGEDKGTTYFSMEFVDGQTLGSLVREKRRLDVEE